MDSLEEPTPIHFRGESHCDKIRRKLKSVFENITIEPLFLFQALFCSLDQVSNDQLILQKSCINDFDFPNGTCDDLINHEAANTAVQNEVAQYNVYVIIITHVFPFLAAFYFGSWSDKFGRKWIMYVCYACWCLQAGIHLLNVYFIDWPKEFLLLQFIPYALSGGDVAYDLSVGAFIADISDPENRAFRIFVFGFAYKIGSPVGIQLGKYLFSKGSFLCVSSAKFVARIIAYILLIIRIEIYYRNEKKEEKEPEKQKDQNDKKKENPLSLHHVKDSFLVLSKPRKNGKRFYFLLYLLVIMIGRMSFEGEGSVAYSYVRTRYGWEVSEWSDFKSVTKIVESVGQALVVPLIAYLELSSSNLVPVLMMFITTRHLIKALAKEAWMMYLAECVDFLGHYTFTLSRALASNCVDNSELGKAFAFLSSIDSLVPIGLSQVYTSLWRATSGLGHPLIGSCFFLSSVFSTAALLLSCVGMIRLRGRDTADLGDSITHRYTAHTQEEL